MPRTYWISLALAATPIVVCYIVAFYQLTEGDHVLWVPRAKRPVWFPILAFWFTIFGRRPRWRPSLYVAAWLAIAVALFVLVQSGNTYLAGIGAVVATWRPLEIVFAQVKINLWDRGKRRSPARSVGLGFTNLLEVVIAAGMWFSIIAVHAPNHFKPPSPGAWESIRLALPLGPSPNISLQGWEPQFISVTGTLVLAFVTLFVLAVLASEVASRRTS